MPYETFIIEIDGEEITDVYQDLMGFEVEMDDELAGMFRLHIGMTLQPDGVWTHLDDERFRIWKPVVISAGFGEASDELISGYITNVKPLFDPEPSRVMLEIWGMDKSVLLDREEVLKDWPGKKDSDIATEIFNLYGLTPVVEDTSVVHDENVTTIIQRETDMRFLRRLALRNGYECYVQGDSGYFRPPQIDADPQPVLSAHFGNQTTLNDFKLDVNALAPANVAMFQVDRASKETMQVTADSSEQTALGATDAAGFQGTDVEPARNYVARNGASSEAEMTALCQGLFHQGEWFVTAEGDVPANLYAHVLVPRSTVTIRGIGETYSGVYYVTHVTHIFNSEGYRQHMKAKRNGLLLTGSENFAVDSGGLLGAVGL